MDSWTHHAYHSVVLHQDRKIQSFNIQMTRLWKSFVYQICPIHELEGLSVVFQCNEQLGRFDHPFSKNKRDPEYKTASVLSPLFTRLISTSLTYPKHIMFFKVVFALYLAVISLAAPTDQSDNTGSTSCSSSCPLIKHMPNQTNVVVNVNGNGNAGSSNILGNTGTIVGPH